MTGLAGIIRAASGLAAMAANGRALGGITRRSAKLAQALRAADDGRAAALMSGGTAPPRPILSDWGWRPDPWQVAMPFPTNLGSGTDVARGVKLFHDASANACIGLKQTGASVPHGFDLSVSGFDGTYLSLVFDLPAAALAGLSRAHLIGLGFVLRGRMVPLVFTRITLLSGPNPLRAETRLVLPEGGGAALAEFDMHTLGINERRLTSGWCDLVISHPPEGILHLDDLVLYRTPRAAF